MKNDGLILSNQLNDAFIQHILSICPSAYDPDCSHQLEALDSALRVISPNKRITSNTFDHIRQTGLNLIEQLETCIQSTPNGLDTQKKERIRNCRWFQTLAQRKCLYVNYAERLSTLAHYLSNDARPFPIDSAVEKIKSCVNTLYQVDETIQNVITAIEVPQITHRTGHSL